MRCNNAAAGLMLGVVSIAALSPGCATTKKKTVAWMPKPCIGWERLMNQPMAPPYNAYRLVSEEPTTGLFPCSIAVARVAIDESASPDMNGELRPRLLTDPRNEFLQWNAAFDDLVAIGEVFPIAERTLGGGRAEPEQILAAYRALGAKLGFIYAINELSENRTEILAVLYRVAEGQPLVMFHAEAVSVPPPDDSKKAKRVNLWETDSRALVRDMFERMAHACIRELIHNDRPAALEDTTGWKPLRPTYSPEWPPRDVKPQH